MIPLRMESLLLQRVELSGSRSQAIFGWPRKPPPFSLSDSFNARKTLETRLSGSVCHCYLSGTMTPYTVLEVTTTPYMLYSQLFCLGCDLHLQILGFRRNTNRLIHHARMGWRRR
jgi:hypothetical protein